MNFSLTLAFWNGRPLDSSFISTVDVLISMENKTQRENSECRTKNHVNVG